MRVACVVRRAGAALAALLLATGCTSAGDRASDQAHDRPTGRATEQPTDGAGTTNATAFGGGVGGYHPGPCPFGDLPATAVRIDCGTLVVPETRGSDARWVSVAVARLRTNAAVPADPVLYLEGGPGGSALSSAERWTDPPSPILERHDVILVDPRGTGYSSPRLTCDPEFEDPANDELEEPALLETCHRRLTDDGIELDRYNTLDTADDLVDLRHALGLERWNLLGVSYGTRLALELMQRDPAGTRAAVLDSVYPPGVRGIDEQAANAYDALHALLEGCAGDATCARDHPDLEARLLATVDRLDRRPVTIDLDDGTGEGGTEPYDYAGADLVDDLFFALYDNALIPDVPDIVELAVSGDVQGAADLLAPELAPIPTDEPIVEDDELAPEEVIRPDDSDGLFYTVECREEVPNSSRAGIDAASTDIPPALREDLVFGAEFELDSCESWPVTPAPLSPVTSDVPTLLLGGAYDPITPLRWAHEAARTLSRSEVVAFDGIGHAAIDGGRCPLDMIEAFLDDPTRSVGDSCTTTPTFR